EPETCGSGGCTLRKDNRRRCVCRDSERASVTVPARHLHLHAALLVPLNISLRAASRHRRCDVREPRGPDAVLRASRSTREPADARRTTVPDQPSDETPRRRPDPPPGAAPLIGFLTLGVVGSLAVVVAFIVIRRAGNFSFARPSREVLFTVLSRED